MAAFAPAGERGPGHACAQVTMATNYFGTFYLTQMLLENLKASAPSRMVITNSLSEMHGHLDFDDLKCALAGPLLSSCHISCTACGGVSAGSFITAGDELCCTCVRAPPVPPAVPLHAGRGERFQKDGRPRSGYKAYACSKLALSMFARELQRRLRTAAPGAAGTFSHRDLSFNFTTLRVLFHSKEPCVL